MRALIVDDEPTVRLLLSRILRRELDCAVTEATNGIEALDLLGRQPFDFVVIDVMMPVMDGIETLEAIRATPAIKHLPVMVLSAVRHEDQVRRLVALGVSAYLTKPLRAVDAGARIRRFVSALGGGSQESQQAQGRTLRGLADNATILVVDGDADFRQFVRSTLGHRYVIAEAEGGAQGLRACLSCAPAAVLLGQDLGAVPAPMFLRKLRSLPHLARVPVVVADSRGAGVPVAYADAAIHRTFVPETFRRQFDALVTGGGEQKSVLGLRPTLRPQMISAIEQVFGLMLGIEVFAEAGDPPPPPAGGDLARVSIALPNEDSDLEFGIVTARDMSERMSALFGSSPDPAGGGNVTAALQEAVRVISGRLQNALRAHGDEVSLQRPLVECLGSDVFGDRGWVGVTFTTVTGDLRFVGFLRSTPRAESPSPLLPADSHA